jgi:hypothetical protein
MFMGVVETNTIQDINLLQPRFTLSLQIEETLSSFPVPPFLKSRRVWLDVRWLLAGFE